MTTLEILKGISQVLANKFDGAVDEKGEPHKIGMKREVENPLIDSRLKMDGFGAAFCNGNQLKISYHAQVNLSDVHDKNFKTNVEKMLDDIASFIKTEYKKAMGTALSLKGTGDTKIRVESSNARKSWITSCKHFEIGGVDSLPVKTDKEYKPEKKFLELIKKGKDDAKRPENELIKPKDNQREDIKEKK